MESDDKVFHLRCHFTGRVQGVGVRYATLQVAKGFEVTGYVKNLIDGRVELEAEGVESECREFLVAVQEELEGYIRGVETVEQIAAKRFSQFVIA